MSRPRSHSDGAHFDDWHWAECGVAVKLEFTDASTVKAMWMEYALACGIPRDGIQWQETEQAFYSGAYAFLAAQFNLIGGDLPEDDGVAWLEARKKEIEDAQRIRVAQAKAEGRL